MWPRILVISLSTRASQCIFFGGEPLAEAQQTGKVKSIGVSNFRVDHLEKLQEADVGPTPAVNQVCHNYQSYLFLSYLLHRASF
jgi:aryl-alcohol dehydrogenase-like predicted oxidoreductase